MGEGVVGSLSECLLDCHHEAHAVDCLVVMHLALSSELGADVLELLSDQCGRLQLTVISYSYFLEK